MDERETGGKMGANSPALPALFPPGLQQMQQLLQSQLAAASGNGPMSPTGALPNLPPLGGPAAAAAAAGMMGIGPAQIQQFMQQQVSEGGKRTFLALDSERVWGSIRKVTLHKLSRLADCISRSSGENLSKSHLRLESYSLDCATGKRRQ